MVPSNKWLSENGFDLSIEKTICNKIHLIAVKESVKYLGLVIDNKLSWSGYFIILRLMLTFYDFLLKSNGMRIAL